MEPLGGRLALGPHGGQGGGAKNGAGNSVSVLLKPAPRHFCEFGFAILMWRSLLVGASAPDLSGRFLLRSAPHRPSSTASWHWGELPPVQLALVLLLPLSSLLGCSRRRRL